MSIKPTFFLTEKEKVPRIVLQGPLTKEAVQYMERHGIVGLRLSAYLGWRDATLDLLHSVPFVEALDILTAGLRDISAIYGLKQLSFLSLNGKMPAIEFQLLPRLRTLALGEATGIQQNRIENAGSIRKLGIFKPKAATLNGVTKLPRLEQLGLSFAAMKDLTWAFPGSGIRRLNLMSCNKLESLEGIAALRSISVLWIEDANNLQSIDCLRGLQQLRTLVLTNCPKIRSIKALSGLASLESVLLMQGTNIQDGDVSPLAQLTSLRCARFVNRSHYSHVESDFPKDSPFY